MDEQSLLIQDESGAMTPVHQHEQSFRWRLDRTVSADGTSFVVRRTLGTFAGVFSPVALSMFSTLLFLRLGFVVGQAGLIHTLIQLGLAYLILYLTILSICAISTNGAIEGGGAYYMISRALGPEFGGSIGLLFFLANIASCALYISGFVEGMLDNFADQGSLVLEWHADPIPSGTRWWTYLYCTIILAFCLFICLIGSAMFARTSAITLMVLCVCTISVMGSFLFEGAQSVRYPTNNPVGHPVNGTNSTAESLNYTGLSVHTFLNNIKDHYSKDYFTGKEMHFATVFAILFSSVTGIMNGANMSGELKEPSKSIPRGTMAATLFTLCAYLILTFLASATCSRELLLNNYNFMQPVNVWPPFIAIGIFAATLSAALGNLIGASRILEALARDEIFWFLLRPATITTRKGNPYVAVFISWFLVQLTLLIGSLNAIAPMASELFLLSYAATNLACLTLKLASAPNFRPTFTFFSWHSCVLGLIGCLVMCFLINPIYASVAIVLCMILVIVLHLRTMPQDWGSISQALIFHQVRKYLLLLDTRKEHIKFWRPQMLLMVSNPRSCCDLMDFINDLKKSGLYVLGNVQVDNLDRSEVDPCQTQYPVWLKLVDTLRIKAFVEITMAGSVREGMQHLVRVSGLGGMKPNTICLGFYDDAVQEDTFSCRMTTNQRRIKFYTRDEWEDDFMQGFQLPRNPHESKFLGPEEYMQMIRDVFKMKKNLCLFRHFHMLNKADIFKAKNLHIDVWPMNLFRPESANYFDNTCMFMLQLACILHMVPKWKSSTVLRVFMCAGHSREDTNLKLNKLSEILRQLRIPGLIETVSLESATASLPNSTPEGSGDNTRNAEYINALNTLIKGQCQRTAVVFCYLPKISCRGEVPARYLTQLDLLTTDLPPTVLVHGTHPVTSTTL